MAGETLLMYALTNDNEHFLKEGLRNSVIDSNYLNPREKNISIPKELL